MHIGVDIDNVINYLDQFLADLVQEHYGIKVDTARWHKYYIEDSFPEIKKEWVNHLFEEISMKQNQALKRLKVNEQAVKRLHELSECVEISLITSRPEWIRPHTSAWLEANSLTRFIQRTYYDETKIGTIKRLGVDMHVDDHPELAISIANAGIPVLLYKKLWNKDIRHKAISHVSDWNEIYLKVLGVAHAMHG